ncbi:MAG: type II toxin-antitoxin system VapC family toxin [Chloroflexota bacterium]|nr:type II toxin-antitoxin system VapC family toxin [Chloroflexota bacterium]
MGKLTALLSGHQRIALDTAIFIYHLEYHPRYLSLTQELLAGVEAGIWPAVTSTVTLLELTVRPWQLERPDVARAYEEALVHFPHLTLVDVTPGVAQQAAQLRAQYNLRPADALHAATALTRDATAFVTNDRDFARLSALLNVIILSDCFL